MRNLRIKIGNAELELASDADFESDLKLALEAFNGLRTSARPALSDDFRGGHEHGASSHPTSDVGINAVVSHLGGGSARAILRAAAVHLAAVDGKGTFSKDEWIARAHEAHEWQKSFSQTQSRDIRRMIAAKEILEKSGGQFAVPPKQLQEAMAKFKDD